MRSKPVDPESVRLAEDDARAKNWKRFGPYLSERQWGTVREDYSPDGACWDAFSHDHARSRAYRWGEDGLLGISDRECRLAFSVALWNGRDPILKERLFGLTGPEGNHGEDVKELYYYLDSTPTHSYMKALYRYPQAEFPYGTLVQENARRGREQPEFELVDTGVLDGNRFFDVQAEYAKAGPDEILIRLTITNRGPDAARVHVLPSLWFRNTWSWGCSHEGCTLPPRIEKLADGSVRAQHPTLGSMLLHADLGDGLPATLLFTENETNTERLFGVPNRTPFVKDAFHEVVVSGRLEAANPKAFGTKCAWHKTIDLGPGRCKVLSLRLQAEGAAVESPFGAEFERTFARREEEAHEFYAKKIPASLRAEERAVARQAYAGLLWSKQFYHYVVKDWLSGDPAQPKPPDERYRGRNADWGHVFNRDVISMPDKWEYPWYAAWDLAFHMIPMARVDPGFAKQQLLLFLREWYMHPSGQIPAYEFALGDVNPPVHAWAVWRVYKLSGEKGHRDRKFLARAFQKLMINFTWWVNRKDVDGKHLFAGGFLGLDNIGVFDRSRPLPTGGHLEQADGTAWMAFYCTTMLAIALELASGDDSYEDVASKFFEHFVSIADAMNGLGGSGLWDEEDGFYYDHLHIDEQHAPLKLRSMVGLIPLLTAEIIDEGLLEQLPGFAKRFRWFLENRPDLAANLIRSPGEQDGARWLLSIPSRERLERVLRFALDEAEFLAPHGLRSLSRCYREEPFRLLVGGETFSVTYTPGESDTGLFGGNSNWRGPIWFPLNYLLIEALERYHHFYGDSLQVECPKGSGRLLDLRGVAQELSGRLASLFLPDRNGHRPCHGGDVRYAEDPCWKDLVLFHEYFHGEDGRGVGASHQTGWTALVVRLLESLSKDREPASQRERVRRPDLHASPPPTRSART